jgi:hypothetical protein
LKKIDVARKSTKEKSRKLVFHLPKKPRKNTAQNRVGLYLPATQKLKPNNHTPKSILTTSNTTFRHFSKLSNLFQDIATTDKDIILDSIFSLIYRVSYESLGPFRPAGWNLRKLVVRTVCKEDIHTKGCSYAFC